ncbi:hypothetical protein GCM10009740_25790 [Terrabacter terrae]|uniref:Uncharacterized protein n=1 Tax=Terrabacter terrae TaxID=318434 RepID=A0ABN2UCV2_9MICO
MTPNAGEGRAVPDRPDRREPSGLTRRGLLTLGAVGAVGAVAAGGAYAVSSGPGLPDLLRSAGFADPAPPELRLEPRPVDRTELTARRRVGGATHVYEVTGRPVSYYVTEPFGARLDRWLALHRRHVGQVPEEIRSYGAWVPASPTSWHSSGEAIDIARLRAGGRDLTSLRHDLWRDAPAPELRRGSRSTGAPQRGCTTSSPTC